jgi:hypothetical protein
MRRGNPEHAKVSARCGLRLRDRHILELQSGGAVMLRLNRLSTWSTARVAPESCKKR